MTFKLGRYRCRNGDTAIITDRFHGFEMKGHVEGAKFPSQFWHTRNQGGMYTADVAQFDGQCTTYRDYKDAPNDAWDLIERIGD